MGDHLVILVDDMLTESRLGLPVESRNTTQTIPISALPKDEEKGVVPRKRRAGDGTPGGQLAECRICQDEEEDANMEAPCSCSGSLKYAHRDCVQRWCNEKGDIMCEICLQQFKPGYTASPKLFDYCSNPMNSRRNWEIHQRDIHHGFLTMVPTNSDFIGPDFDDYSISNTRSILYCRSVAIIFTVLLVLRHALPMIISGIEHYSLTQFTLLLLRTVGTALPLYIMLRAVSTFRRRRRQQPAQVLSISTPEGEHARAHSSPAMQPQPHLIRVHQ